ncbi:hypothetical protein BJV78DRAFT_1176767 [Lactifluus subvellereus]|nr:hypothetical protein BJV78DRAFT_1176767 [Lactifluus subvellereus]
MRNWTSLGLIGPGGPCYTSEMVQNQAVRLISGSFCTAPLEPLHQMLAPSQSKLPRESQLLKRLEQTWVGWATVTESDLPLPVPVTWRLNFTTTLTGIARRFIPETALRPRPHAIPPWSLPNGGDARCALTEEICTLAGSTSTLLIFATDWHATSAVAYHQGPEVRHSERLVRTESAGNLIAARAIESAAALAQLILVEWQANRKDLPNHLVIMTNNAGSINRIAKFGPHPTQPADLAKALEQSPKPSQTKSRPDKLSPLYSVS